MPAIILLTLLLAATYWSFQKAVLPHKLTLGGAMVGVLLSIIFPVSWGSESRITALGNSLSGFIVGLATAWILIELGKLVFGKVKHQYVEPLPWSVTQPDDEQPPVVNFGDEAYGWADVFSRGTDCLAIECPTLIVSGRSFENVKAVLKMETLVVRSDGSMEEAFPLQYVTALSGTATEMVMPREAMGFGVALLTAMTGTFVGPKLAVYMLGGSLLLLIIVTILYACSTRTRSFPRMEVAPFMLLSCLLFLALRHFSIV